MSKKIILLVVSLTLLLIVIFYQLKLKKDNEVFDLFEIVRGNVYQEVSEVGQFAIVIFASIAILVGGIGITNTMFTSIRERTREIGIMKAIGAKNSAVLTIFLIEAGIIGLVGGTGGIVWGIICAKIIELYTQANSLFYFSISISPGLILFGLAFSILTGCISGFFPARRAARLKPVEALRRYE